MKREGVVRWTFAIFVCLAAAGAGTSVGARAQAPERVLDRVVTPQDSLFTSIPSVARLCDSPRLAHRRVRVGDAEVYVEEAGGALRSC